VATNQLSYRGKRDGELPKEFYFKNSQRGLGSEISRGGGRRRRRGRR